MKRPVINSDSGSLYVGTLPLGCQLCHRGQKLVLFIGGKCSNPKRCSWYCPISERRKGSDLIFADEILANGPKDIIEEAKLIKAFGASITGGDPLFNEDQRELSLFYIEELKNEFGDSFHIHLYTSGVNFTPLIADDLMEAGLDEIRFHPAEKDFHRIQYALDRGMRVGAEVPVIPTPEHEEYLWNLIDYLDNIGVDFVNFNEFEMNEPNHKELLKRGFKIKEDSIASVEGSKELAYKILTELPDRYTISVHFCSVALKDGTQLRNRYKRRAESIKYPYEEVTKDGTLIFLRVSGTIDQVNRLYAQLRRKIRIPKSMMALTEDSGKLSLDLPWFLSEDENSMRLIKDNKVSGGLYEILPFRRAELYEVCEFTPIL
ncbi:MAG: radical SAM protein [Candidatus Lokiarchaeota archaeon]|nr:radical SAM protein [Candidatus Lokiarchaeota archaeon]